MTGGLRDLKAGADEEAHEKENSRSLLLAVSRTTESRSSGWYWTALMVLVVLARPDHTMKSRLFAAKAPPSLI